MTVHRKPLIKLAAIPIALVLAFLLWPFAFTAIPTEDSRQKSFDPVAYVDDVWDEVMSTIRSEAVDLPELLTAMRPDEDGIVTKSVLLEVTKERGLITDGEAHVYMVKGNGTVRSVDPATGACVVELDGYSGPIEVSLLLGPNLPAGETSVRDATGLISYGDFPDQVPYGMASAELNRRAMDALSSIDRGSLRGKSVAFYGTTAIRTFNLVTIDIGEMNVVPVELVVR